MSARQLIAQFNSWRAAGEELVLATVIETAGSTYSKAGRHLLIDKDSNYAGLVGGGCLEGDLVLQAAEVLTGNTPRVVAYDMRDDADDLWGMGLGCRGMMRLLLQPLTAANDWQPFARIAAANSHGEPAHLALVVESSSTAHAVGELLDTETTRQLNAKSAQLPALVSMNDVTALVWTTQPWPRLLILGGGPDAAPVIGLAEELGWETTVADHREALIEHARLDAASARKLVVPGELGNTLATDAFSAIIVMSHHLATDIEYLRELASVPCDYIGVLGPAERKAEILKALVGDAGDLATRLHGPVGLDIGAETPASIALALLAEIHAVTNHKTGAQLSVAKLV